MSNKSTTLTGAQSSSGSSMAEIHPRSQLISIKLTDSNYLLWRQQILAAVTGYGVEGYLTGDQEIPEKFLSGKSEDETIRNPAYHHWLRQDQLLVSWLLSSLTENMLITTVGLKTSKDVWQTLETAFGNQNSAKIMQLQTLRKGTMPMREYLNKVKSCCDMLSAVGKQVEEWDQVCHILSGLGSEYDPVMVSITSRVVPCSLSEVHSILLSFENRLEQTDIASHNGDGAQISANLTTQHQGVNYRRGYNQGGRGWNNNQFQGDNQFSPRGGRRGGTYRGRGGRNFSNRARCQICHYSNHTADKCFYRSDLNFVPKGGSNTGHFQVQANTSQYNPSVSMSQCPSLDCSIGLYIDSTVPLLRCYSSIQALSCNILAAYALLKV
ncbi:hypothetical protein DH2020_024529 [Rehmannia glutinosa]|uniref:Retrotransposon Copia-like N-terminal domain-containing protein n=1 Tax=Rehmannia glutinosa TaxID=99300 RepID=A0ABR0W337_REHGL